MSLENRSPAFSLYPDKAKAGTDHLSDRAFRIYWSALWWMWLNSPDYCSIIEDKLFICRKLKLSNSAYDRYWIGEIMDPMDPLLRQEGKYLISNGLRKEARRQNRYSEAARKAAEARWVDCDRNATAMRSECIPSPIPSPIPSTKKKTNVPVKEILDEWKRLFPKKSQPREPTVRGKIITRWKTDYFRNNWKKALEISSQSHTCQTQSWFTFEFFVRNELNYIKMLDNWMAWKDRKTEEDSDTGSQSRFHSG
jgi:hypothetical protein